MHPYAILTVNNPKRRHKDGFTGYIEQYVLQLKNLTLIMAKNKTFLPNYEVQERFYVHEILTDLHNIHKLQSPIDQVYGLEGNIHHEQNRVMQV